MQARHIYIVADDAILSRGQIGTWFISMMKLKKHHIPDKRPVVGPYELGKLNVKHLAIPWKMALTLVSNKQL